MCDNKAVVDVLPCVPVTPIIFSSFDNISKNFGLVRTFNLFLKLPKNVFSIVIADETIYR